jgi:molybdopterin/thiamine biosynthesis adenylyltransferase
MPAMSGSTNLSGVTPFAYDRAFSRNIGWVTRAEQDRLRHKCVAIAGMGGAGGLHLLTLCRLGIARFRIADFDQFEIENFNRQIGATLSAVGQAKVDVLAAMAREINPEVQIECFPHGVASDNLREFLDGADLYVDGLDFFAFAARQATFAMCAELGVPAVTAAPLGMGAAVLNFLPGKMTFEDYFRWGDLPETEKALRFLTGLSPAALHTSYLVDASAVNFSEQRGPSTIIGCEMCAAMAAAEALKILLGRGPLRGAPHGVQFDAYRNKFVQTWRPGGSNNPLQWLLRLIVRRRLARAAAHG